MNCKPDLETSVALSEAQDPYRRSLAAVASQHPADRSAAVVTYRDLREGLDTDGSRQPHGLPLSNVGSINGFDETPR
jgi:hypothetical protein